MAKPLPVRYPQMHYFRCIDAQNQPANYAGDWPEQGKVYSGNVRTNMHTGAARMWLDGFHAEEPWGCFTLERFEHFATLHLN